MPKCGLQKYLQLSSAGYGKPFTFVEFKGALKLRKRRRGNLKTLPATGSAERVRLRHISGCSSLNHECRVHIKFYRRENFRCRKAAISSLLTVSSTDLPSETDLKRLPTSTSLPEGVCSTTMSERTKIESGCVELR